MGPAIALIIVGVLLFHAGAIGLIIHVARAAGQAGRRRLVLESALSLLAGIALILGGIFTLG